MKKYNTKGLISGLEANMNYLLRAHKEGRVEDDHLHDIIKLWGRAYKMCISIQMIAHVLDMESISEQKVRLGRLALTLVGETLRTTDQLTNMFETLIEGYKNDKGSNLQDEGQTGSQESDDVRVERQA